MQETVSGGVIRLHCRCRIHVHSSRPDVCNAAARDHCLGTKTVGTGGVESGKKAGMKVSQKERVDTKLKEARTLVKVEMVASFPVSEFTERDLGSVALRCQGKRF